MASEAFGRDSCLANEDSNRVKQHWIEVDAEQARAYLKAGRVVWFRPERREEKFLVAKD